MEQDEKKVNKKTEKDEEKASKMRQVVIETDGSNISIVKSEVAGKLEFIALLEETLKYVRGK